MGAAIRDGYIKSMDDIVSDYIPQMKGSAYDQAEQAMVQQMGAGPNVAKRLIEFVQCLNEGHVMEPVQRTVGNTTPTDMKDFAATFKAVYEMN